VSPLFGVTPPPSAPPLKIRGGRGSYDLGRGAGVGTSGGYLPAVDLSIYSLALQAFCKELFDLVRRQRLAEEEPLHFVAVVGSEERKLLIRLYALGDDL
jgi:hypothetical protein